MPILNEPNPLDMFSDAGVDDEGLKYWETQKLWRHRAQPFFDQIRTYLLRREKSLEPPPVPKTYARAKRIPLRPDPKLLESHLSNLLARRQTRREFSSEKPPVSFECLSTLLVGSYGTQGSLFPEHERILGDGATPARTIPSTGGLFTSELYFYANEVSGLEKGLYHFHPTHCALEQVKAGDFSLQVEATIPYQPLIDQLVRSAGTIYLTTVFGRSRPKYAARYLKFCLMEVGAVYQNLDLCAASAGLGLYPQGSVFEGEANKLLQIDGRTEAAVMAIAIGP